MARKMLIDGEPAALDVAGGEEGTNFDFDLFVIGAGSGGVRASRFSANFGAKVGICELPFHPISSETIGGVGGTCVIRGCVPKKILVYGASFGGELEDARSYGWELSEKVDFNWKKLLQKKTDEINRLNGIYKRLLSNAGVKLFEGEGKVVGPNEVEVTQLDGTKLSYSAKHILIATGSRAQFPNIPGQELGITSDEALSLEELPKRAVILGGGYIAVEFASIWQGMGSTVHLVFRRELPLRGFDDEMRAVVARNLEGRGINLHPRTTLTQLIKTEDGIKVVTDHGEELMADVVLFATGFCRASKVVDLFPTVSPEVIVRETTLMDYWEVAEIHCSCFFPEYSFPLDFVLRIDRSVVAMLAAMLAGLSRPRGCKRITLVAVIGSSLDETFSFRSGDFKIAGFDWKFSLSKGYVAGILTVDNFADFLPRRRPLRQRRTGIAYISNVAVRENFRRKGIAKKLIAKAESLARSWGCRAIALHCDLNNSMATKLYQGQGYKCIKVPEGAKWPQPKTSPDIGFNFMMKLLNNSTAPN